MKLIKEISLNYAQIQLFEPSLVRIDIQGDIVMTRKETKEINEIIGILSQGKEVPVMILADPTVQFDSSSREFSASAEGFKYTKAEALIIRSLAHRILADFYLKVNRPPKPSRTFPNEEAALQWLNTFNQSTGTANPA